MLTKLHCRNIFFFPEIFNKICSFRHTLGHLLTSQKLNFLFHYSLFTCQKRGSSQENKTQKPKYLEQKKRY